MPRVCTHKRAYTSVGFGQSLDFEWATVLCTLSVPAILLSCCEDVSFSQKIHVGMGWYPFLAKQWPHHSDLWGLFHFLLFPTLLKLLADSWSCSPLAAILLISGVHCSLTLSHMSCPLYLEWKVSFAWCLLNLSILLCWVALETEASSNSSSQEPENLELGRTCVALLCDTLATEASRILTCDGQFHCEFHTHLCW